MTLNKVPEHNLTKLYYSIGEVATMFDVNTSLIRFWEKEFQIVTPKKNRKGNRLFSPKDIANLNKIYYLVRTKGFTLDGAKNALKTKEDLDDYVVYDEKSEENQVIKKLELIKTRLIDLKSL
ncbi:MAG: MerR family transcriptional regulator [Crocinitomicaceae bacterium]|nr:MerR family transcriptional regulator [Crocinitomicaceae bacterium]